MDFIQTIYESLRVEWRALLPDAFVRSIAGAVLHLVAIFLVVLLIEKVYRTRTNNYRSRSFAYDLGYYFYYRSGVHVIFVTAAIFTALEAPLSFLDLKLLSGIPFAAQIILWLVLLDLLMYWLHRAQHAFRFLWAFHSTHHAADKLTFASFLRFHPVEVFVGECLAYVALRILGFNLNSWIAAFLITTFLGEIQHTQIPWKFGPAYRLVVSPVFHSYHHSTNPAHHDRNFGGLFSCWDYLFGTAVPDDAPAPTSYGLPDVKPTSFLGTLTTPFVLLRQYFLIRPKAPGAIAPKVSGDKPIIP